MPSIDNYKCTNCDFEMPQGWGTYFYAIDPNGIRIRCSHPGEVRKSEEITGLPYREAKKKNLLGVISFCICIDCLNIQELDLDRDPIKCKNCESLNIVSQNKLVGKLCPKCQKGKFQKTSTGLRC